MKNDRSPRMDVAGIPDRVIWDECTAEMKRPCRKCPRFEAGRMETSGCRVAAEMAVRDRMMDCAAAVQ